MKPDIGQAFSIAVWLIIAGLCLSALEYSEAAGTNAMKTIEGSVWYRERMMLPPDAEITVSLEDVSKMDVAAAIIVTTTFPAAEGPPWDFAMEYDPLRINSRHRYAVRARIEANGQLLFTNTTQIPVFSGAEGMPVEILVSRVGGGRGSQRSTPTTPNASLVNMYWKLVELDGRPATLGAGKRELHMVLMSEGSHVRGFSGCNRFTDGYEVKDGQLRFKKLASTMTACMEGMEQEQRFLENLRGTIRFTISGDDLALYSSDEQLILRFEAVALQ